MSDIINVQTACDLIKTRFSDSSRINDQIIEASRKGFGGVIVKSPSVGEYRKLESLGYNIHQFYEIPPELYIEKKFYGKIGDDDEGSDLYLVCWNL